MERVFVVLRYSNDQRAFPKPGELLHSVMFWRREQIILYTACNLGKKDIYFIFKNIVSEF